MGIDDAGPLLDRVVAGDVAALPELRRCAWPEVVVAAGTSAHVLTAPAVARALRALHAPGADPREVQAWASFVRRGTFGGARTPTVRIPIAYDHDVEGDPLGEAIIEATSRLDELGDLVDGDISPTEARRLMERLGA